MRRTTPALSLLAAAMAAAVCCAEQAPPPAAFEVASVKRGDPSDTRVRVSIAPGGRFTAANATGRMLVAQAFDIRDNQISGGPAWLQSEPWNIDAKAPEGLAIPSGSQGGSVFREMLRSLLVDRFALRFHWQPRDENVYQLVVAKGGPKMHPAEAREGSTQGLRSGAGSLTGFAAPIPTLASRLSQQLGRPVIDKTGLAGLYDFTLQFAPDSNQNSNSGSTDADASLPSIFTALQESLGLKLESTKAVVQILVIDSAEQPSEN